MPNDSAISTSKLKYMFDLCFDEEPTVDDESDLDEEPEVPPPPPPPMYSEAELEAAKAKAFKDGRDAGLNEAGSSIEQRAATALESIAGTIATSTQDLDRTNDATIHDFVMLTGQVLERVLPAYARTHGTAEIESLARDCFAHLRTTGRVSVRVGADMQSTLETRLQEAAQSAGYVGEVVVEPDESLAAGEASLSWSDGGAERRMDTIWAEVDAAISRAIHSLEAGQVSAPPVADAVSGAAEAKESIDDDTGTQTELPEEMASQVTAVAEALEDIPSQVGGEQDVAATTVEASEEQTAEPLVTEPEGRD